MKWTILAAVTFFSYLSVPAQTLFPDKCIGTWNGVMKIYAKGKLRDSVSIKFTVARKNDTVWTWHTQYISAKMPVSKAYTLRLKNKAANEFITDEGDGILLNEYVSENKMYSQFETQGFYLTSTYELVAEHVLVFEVTSATKSMAGGGTDVINYSVNNIQRVVLKREN